jgi:hypothetical protein
MKTTPGKGRSSELSGALEMSLSLLLSSSGLAALKGFLIGTFALLVGLLCAVFAKPRLERIFSSTVVCPGVLDCACAEAPALLTAVSSQTVLQLQV